MQKKFFAYTYYEEEQHVVENFVPGPPPLRPGMPGYIPGPPPLRPGQPGYVPPPPPHEQLYNKITYAYTVHCTKKKNMKNVYI